MSDDTKAVYTGLDAPSAKIGAIALGVVGAAGILLLPGLVGVMAESLSLGPSEVGWLASADLTTMGLAMFFMAFVIHRVDWRVAAMLSLALLCIGAGWSASAESFNSIIVARLLSGWGGGTAMSVAFALLGGMANPDRQFGLYMVCAPSFGAIGLYLIQAIATHDARAVVFTALVVVTLLSFVPMIWLPRRHENSAAIQGSANPGVRLPYTLVGLGLVGVFFYFLAQGNVWAYIERIGNAAEISVGVIGKALSAASIAGIVGAFIAMQIHTRFGRAAPLFVSAVVSLVAVALLDGEVGVLDFVVASALFNLAWNFSQPLFSGLMAELDPSGRAVVMMGAVLTVGIGIGPAVAALIITDDLSPVIYIAIAAIAISQVFVQILIRLNSR